MTSSFTFVGLNGTIVAELKSVGFEGFLIKTPPDVPKYENDPETPL
ncbi:MAG: hypothetical protein Q7I96_06540 [Methanobacteriaceae archaeon]|nr:hypothetical protein [Methanobacteriaceae archaeon]